jgi:hypothetical protein
MSYARNITKTFFNVIGLDWCLFFTNQAVHTGWITNTIHVMKFLDGLSPHTWYGITTALELSWEQLLVMILDNCVSNISPYISSISIQAFHNLIIVFIPTTSLLSYHVLIYYLYFITSSLNIMAPKYDKQF